ncbi:MAG: hypothetical protein ACNA8L_05245 [Luteolibacter sp.]
MPSCAPRILSTGAFSKSNRHTPSQSISPESATIRNGECRSPKSRFRSAIFNLDPRFAHLATSAGEAAFASHLGGSSANASARAESSGRSSNDASISNSTPRVRATNPIAKPTRKSASASSFNHGRETEKLTPANPGQSIARRQIRSIPRPCSTAFIPAKKSRSIDNTTRCDPPGSQLSRSRADIVCHLPANDPAPRGSTSNLPSSAATAAAVIFSASDFVRSTFGTHTTRSIGLGINGSIQLNACKRPLSRHRSMRSARSAKVGTRRTCSRISSERSAAEASVCSSTNTSQSDASRSNVRAIHANDSA